MSEDTYKEGKLNDEQREPLDLTRDTYAAVEVLASTLVMKTAELPHLRDSAARMVNYSFPNMTSAGIAHGDDHLANALMHFQKGLASVKHAHNSDLRVLVAATKNKVEVGRPNVEVLKKFGQRIVDQVKRLLKFGR